MMPSQFPEIKLYYTLRDDADMWPGHVEPSIVVSIGKRAKRSNVKSSHGFYHRVTCTCSI
jgi:hypothetical protein